MDQTAATTNIAHPVDLEALRLQLEEDGRLSCDLRNPTTFAQARERLLHTLQTNDCREIITAAVNEDDLASIFAEAGGRGHVAVLEVCLNHGMNIDIKNSGGWTALIYASCNGHEQCVRLLLDRNANPNLQTDNGYTALIYASQRNYINIVEMLLEKNANPDIQNRGGATALMGASLRCRNEIVQLLLNHGADIDLKNRRRKTALDVAKTEEIKEMLLNHVNTSYVLK